MTRGGSRPKPYKAQGDNTKEQPARPKEAFSGNPVVRDDFGGKQSEDTGQEGDEFLLNQQTAAESYFDNVPVGLCILDADLRYVRVNKCLAEMNGASAAEHIGRTVREIAPVRAAQVEAVARKVFESGEPVTGTEISGTRAGDGGAARTWLEDIRPLKDDKGRVVAVAVCVEDITERKKAEEAVLASKSRIQTILDSITDIYIILDRQWRFVDLNSRAETLLGMNKGDLIGKVYWDLFPHAVGSGFHNELDRAVSEQKPVHFEEFSRAANAWFEAHVYPSEEGLTLYLKDVTDRRKAEEALRESEERWQFALEGAGDGVWDWNAETNKVFISKQWKTMLGFSEDEVVDAMDEWNRRVHPEDRKGVDEEIKRHLEGNSPAYSVEHRMKCKDGTYKWVLGRGKVISRTPEGKPLRMIGTQSDITERKKREEAARESEAKFRAFTESSRSAIFLVQGNKYVYTNAAFEKMTGYGPDDLASMDFWDCIAPEAQELVKERAVLRQKGEPVPQQYDLKFITKSGEERIGDYAATLIEFQGEPAILGSVHDITERRRVEEALRDSEEKYRAIFEYAVEGIYQSTPEGRFLKVNPAMARMCGYKSPEEMIVSVTDIMMHFYVNPHERKTFKETLAQHGIIERFELQVYRKDGTPIWVVTNARAVRDAEGSVLYYEGTCEDITTRKKAEEDLRVAHRQVLDIIEFLPDATFVIDRERKVVAWNKAIEELTGVRKEEIIGKGDYAYAVPFFGKRRPIVIDLVFEMHEESMRDYDHIEWHGGTLVAEVYVPMVYQGRGAYLSARASSLFDPEGNVIGGIDSIRDITEQKRMVEELKESEEQYRTVIESSDDGITMVKEGRHFYVNKRFLEIFGIDSPDQILGKSVGSMVHPDDRERVIDIARRRRLGEPAPQRYEFKGAKTNGDVIFVEASGARTTYKGEPVSLAFIRDVTERKRLEAQLRQSQTLESIGTLAGGIAHDFNNLLMALIGNLSLAKMCLSPRDEAYQFLAEAEHISLSGADLTNRLITFSKGGTPVRKLISMNGLLKDSTEIVLAGSNILCEYSLSGDLLPVKADEAQLRQVVNNIVSNAKEAMPGGGTIKISSANCPVTQEDALPILPGDYVKITFRDQGTGIREEDLPKIFDPYFTTKGMGTERGMGLGLAVVYSIIKRHDGHISVESSPGGGTTVHLYLPAHKEKNLAEKPEKRQGAPIGKVLFMDDDRMIRDVVLKILANAGYNGFPASDGGEAIKLYRDALNSGDPFDVVILDLAVKEGMGGREAMHELLSVDPDVKAIISSGYSDDPVISGYADFGFKGALTKPYKVEEFVKLLHWIVTGTGPV